jgi:alpha-galactosidase
MAASQRFGVGRLLFVVGPAACAWACAAGGALQGVPPDDAGGAALDAGAPAEEAAAPPPTADAGDAASPDAGNAADATFPDAADAADAAPATDAPPPSGTVVVGCTPGSQTVTMTNANVTVAYDLSAGDATFSYASQPKVIGFYAGVSLTSYFTSKSYATHTCTTAGDRTVITSTGSGLPTMEQIFTLGGSNHFLVQVTLQGTSLSSTWMGPVVVDATGSVQVGGADPRLLWVPFDNDNWVSYNAAPLAGSAGTSFEAAAFFDNATRAGVVVGSVTHDTWKTGIYYAGGTGTLTAMNVFGGATDMNWTHDVVPHGKVSGDTIASPVAFVGAGPDWRDLLEEYADANAAQTPKLAWTGGVPFGWNSWGVLQTKISYAAAITVSDFLHTTLQPAGFENDGTVYVNLDSYWDNLTPAQLTDFVAHVHGNGQKAGIYWAPFVDWGLNGAATVQGSTYLYQDIWLKDGSGNPMKLDGAYAVDPTHPGTKARVDSFIGSFVAAGFDYVKLDFLSHGALESSVHYDPKVTTGIAAYNQGMSYVLGKINGTMFVSESIAPLFPYQYGHARRVSCDTFGAAVGQTSAAYELNSAAYGWWMSGRLYTFNDPDELVFQGFTSTDNAARLVSGVVSGTVILDGDDLSSAAGQSAAMNNLTNPRMNAVAKLGKAFRPVDGNTGAGPPSELVLADGSTYYLALFNFGSSAVTMAVDLGHAGLDPSHAYTATDLSTGTSTPATGTLSVPLGVDGAKLFLVQ